MADRKTRISGKVREAIRLMVEEGLSRSQASQKAGMSDHGLYQALRKPLVLAFRAELLEVLRTSEASRVIRGVADLSRDAPSAAVRLDCLQYLAEAAGEGPVPRSEVIHRHNGLVAGLTIIVGGWQPHALADDAGLMIEQPRPFVNMIGSAVPHPSMRKEDGQ